jgi:hypothetical protein
MFGSTKKNIRKNCVMCSNNRFSTTKLCRDCCKIKEFLHRHGMLPVMNFIENYKPNYAPPY